MVDMDLEISEIESSYPFEDAFDAQLYCALFPPDHEFEEGTLVQLWMALGSFTSEPREEHATLFFEHCVNMGDIELCRTNMLTGKAMYKYKCKGESQLSSHIVRVEGSSSLTAVSADVSHLSVTCRHFRDSTAFHDLRRFEQLTALIFLQGQELSLKQVPRDLFLWLTQLLVLDLSNTPLVGLPSSIGNLKCLCFLNLSDTPIKRLPEEMDCLENLQTLKLRGCSNLFTLPEGMRKLVNLRHLDFDVFRQLDLMPEGLGALTRIRTLSAFLVGVEKGRSIRQLEKLNYISGSFCISRLENVLTKDEAHEARLSRKTRIKKLELHWSDSQDRDDVDDDDDVVQTEVLSSLKPDPDLEELYISCYGGSQLPIWTYHRDFSMLVSITLEKCENCRGLPSFGELPSLKCLTLFDLPKVKVIGDKLHHNSGIPGFLRLEKLTVENMSSLEEWSEPEIKSFPRLLHLTVKHCPKLHNLATMDTGCSRLEISHCPVLACPDHQLPLSVETFIIEDCPLFSARFTDPNEYRQILPHTKHLWIDHKQIISEEECPRSLQPQGKPSNFRQYVLQFEGIPDTLFFEDEIVAEGPVLAKVLLLNAVSGQVVKEGPLSSVKVEIVALNGQFYAEQLEEWTKEFCTNIVDGRYNKGPMLDTESVISLHNGVGFIDNVCFRHSVTIINNVHITDYSSKMMRLGAKVLAEEDTVKEAVSTPFQVKLRVGETNRKHKKPSPEELRHLLGISKGENSQDIGRTSNSQSEGFSHAKP